MGAFRKSERPFNFDQGSSTVDMTEVMSTKTVKTKECPEPTTYVEVKSVRVADLAKNLQLPDDADYQLRDMIKAGQIPEEVPVHGMLNSNDPTDLSNNGVGDRILDRLMSETSSETEKPASEPVSTPEPITTPSE